MNRSPALKSSGIVWTDDTLDCPCLPTTQLNMQRRTSNVCF